MTRGNQRDIDRARAQKRSEKYAKGKKEDFTKRQQSDAEIMRLKQKKAEEKKQKEEEELIKQQAAQKKNNPTPKVQQVAKKMEEVKLEEDYANPEVKNENEEEPVEMIQPVKKS